MSALAVDAPPQPAVRWLRQAGIALIRAYQLVVSPLLAPSCRFDPSCSAYAVEAIERHGLFRGSRLAAMRIGRCHPWGGFGHDPVP